MALLASSTTFADEPIVLGALYNSTGQQAGLDIPSAQGARLAVDQTNKHGGVLNRQIVLKIENGQSKPDVVKARTAALLASSPAPVALFGLSDTDLVLASAPLAAKANRVFLTSGATSPLLPAEVPEYLYLACFGDNVQAAAAAEWAHGDGQARKALVLYDSSHEYTRLLQKYFRERFTQLGGEIADERSFTSDTLEQTLEQFPNVDVVFLSAEVPADIQKAVRMIRSSGLDCPIVGGDSFDSAGLWEGSDAKCIYYTTHAYLGENNPNPRVVAFRKAFAAAYPDATPDAFTALGYDATRLLVRAIEQSQTADPEDIRRALAGIHRFEGVTGTLSYPKGSRIPTKSVSLIEVTGGKLRLVREVMPKGVPAP
ncbi:ABC transporter substrate-binding protein [Aeoliella sp. ICT_H6.2]|uniref:ABC transporter substrate-binding protein n=1 Tax=Aeoliella straminimaris TaxID=2954799 RepID=A0A9X2JGE8_9BACT|nr:ABC transporter substrate-binding protein [Aeoliella straminimaris]MCO6044307.1 ABC transporter substrate-binding protein [Aeoliella straminimaris]